MGAGAEGWSFLLDVIIVSTTVGIGLSSLGEANALRKVSLKSDGTAVVKLGSFSPLLFNCYFSSNISWFVYGLTLDDKVITLACGVNVLAFVYYIITILSVLNRTLTIRDVDSQQGGSDFEEGSLRAVFRAFDFQIDSMATADRDRIFERRKAESLFLLILGFWIFYAGFLNPLVFIDTATRIQAIVVLSSAHSALIGVTQLQTIVKMLREMDPAQFNVPMQTVIVINLASYVVWVWDKTFTVLFVLSMNLSICVLKAVIYLYIKTQHSHANAKFVTSGEADTPALTLYAPADEIGNVTETRRLSFSVPLHGMAGSSTHVPPVDVEEPLGGTGGGMNILATTERSLDTDREGYGYTSSEHNEYPPTVYEPILESNPTVNMPLDVHGRTETQAEGLYTEATVSSEEKYSWPATKEEASKEEKELGVIAERKTMISEKESPDEYSPDEYIIPTPQDVDLTKEGAVINNENPLEQRTVPVRTTDSYKCLEE